MSTHCLVQLGKQLPELPRLSDGSAGGSLRPRIARASSKASASIGSQMPLGEPRISPLGRPHRTLPAQSGQIWPLSDIRAASAAETRVESTSSRNVRAESCNAELASHYHSMLTPAITGWRTSVSCARIAIPSPRRGVGGRTGRRTPTGRETSLRTMPVWVRIPPPARSNRVHAEVADIDSGGVK